MRRARTLAVLLVAVAACVGGCGVLAVPGSEPPPPVRPTAHVGAGGALTVGITEPASLDPGYVQGAASRLVVSTMCDTLFDLDPVTGNLAPGIVTAWTVSGGGTDFTLALRHGLTFPDGSAVDALAVERSLSRLARESFASPDAGLLAPVVGFAAAQGQVRNADAYSRSHLAGVQITDPYGLEIRLSYHDADFLRALAEPATAPVSEHGDQCAGPYELAAPWSPGDPVVRLVHRAGFPGVDPRLTAAGRGYLSRVDFRIYPSQAEAVAAFLAGKVDMAEVPLALLAQARRLGSDLVEGNANYEQYVAVAIRPDTPWGDQAVRDALSEALDREAIAATVYGGGRAPATSLVPPALGEEAQPGACGALAPPGGNVPGARARLAAAHVSLRGVRLPFYYPTGYDNAALEAAVATQWHDAFGLVAEAKPLDPAAFLALATEAAGIDGAFTEGWSGAFMSADAYLAPLATTSGLGGANLSGFTNLRFDEVYDTVVRGTEESSDEVADQAERDAAYRKVGREVCSYMPVIPVAFGRVHYLVDTARFGASRGSYLAVDGDPLLREVFQRPGAPTSNTPQPTKERSHA